MERVDSYLYKAVKGDEDSITELLVNLMRRKYLRYAILQSLNVDPDIINTIAFSDIDTQIGENDVGRPDIVIENKYVKIYIEVKTRMRTIFQDSQLSTYPDNLAVENRVTKLIFLIPKDHNESDKIREIERNYNKDRNVVEVVNWDSLINDLQDLEIANDSSVVNEIISFISEKTLNRKLETVFSAMEVAIMFNYKDLKYSANLLFQFRDYISNLANKIDDRLYEVIGERYNKLEKKYNEKDAQQDVYGVGIYLDDGNIYIGFSFLEEDNTEEEKQAEDFIFSVAFYPSKFAFDGNEKGVYQNDECTYVKIDKYILAENNEDKFINSIVKTIKPYYTDEYIQKNDI